MVKKLLFLFCNLWFVAALAQPGKEAWHWYFGRGSTLDFSSGSPVPGAANSLGTGEGSASYSDPVTGQFLFGALATIVFNKNGTVMSNGSGLYGHSSTTQSDLIISKPQDPNIFYIITADEAGPTNKGVHYSVIDLGQQGGLGKVILKNQVLTPPPCTEKLVGAKHCNGIDYWILTHPLNSNAFYAYIVTSSGINTTPVISYAGTAHTKKGNYYEEAIGYMKVSPNGKKIAVGLFSDSIPILEIFDFNNFTGVISNPITINYGLGKSGPYGLSFSPDNSKLYAAPLRDHDSTAVIYQYDITSNSLPSILASQVQLGTVRLRPTNLDPWANQAGAFQMGPDGKIYISMSTDSLSVINNPNNPGLSCNFQMNGLPIAPVYYSWSFGLPNFIDANYAGIQISIPDVQQCNTFSVTTLDAGAGFANYVWSTGASTQTLAINSPGKYWVTVTNQQGCTRTDTMNAYLLLPHKMDTLACDTFHANVAQNGVLHYSWFDGSFVPTRDFTQSGNYYVDINFISGCAVRDSLDLTVVPSPQINIGPDTTFCKGNLVMDASCNTCVYHWSTGENTASVVARSSGTYWVKVIDANGCTNSDTLLVKPQLALLDFVMPNIVTPNNDDINDEIDFGKYQFSILNIEIYNRWGQKVFSSEDSDAVWRPANDDGTYFYTGQYKIDCGTDSRIQELKGFITLVR